MKKNIYRIIFTLMIVLLAITNVKAGFSLEDCGEPYVIVDENPAVYADFEAVEYTCDWVHKGAFEEIGGWELKFEAAKDHGLELVESFFTSADGKGIEGATYPRCEDPKAYVTGEMTASFRYRGVVYYVCPCGDNMKCETGECEWQKVHACPSGGVQVSEPYCFINSEKFETDEDYPAFNGESAAASQAAIKSELEDKINKRAAELNEGSVEGWSSILFRFYCPIYECNKHTFQFGACTPRFSAQGGDVYCVNPNEKYNASYGTVDFDVTECKNSYSTLACGYANIMIEGTYQRKVNHRSEFGYNQINMAMRLWGMYTGRSGFEDAMTDEDEGNVGLSWRVVEPQGPGECTKGEHGDSVFVRPLYNVYRHTYYEYFQWVLHNLPENASSVTAIGCGPLGVACTGSSNTSMTLTAAYWLLHNTIKGNEHMLDHLAELNGSFAEAPTGISFEDGDTAEVTDVIVHYGEITSTTQKGIEVDCNKLVEGTQEYAEIKPYCQDKIIYIDRYGVEHEVEPTSCKKGVGCTYKNLSIAICDRTLSSQTLTVIHKKRKPNVSVREMENCYNVGYQEMYMFLVGGKGPDGVGEELSEEDEEYPFTVPSYSCQGSCENYDVRESDASCTYDPTLSDGELAEGYVKDPSLKCIVNMASPKEKYKYDFSDQFGVNTNFCRIYCSDEVEYKMANRVTLNAGKDVKLNIGLKAGFIPDAEIMLSNIIVERRSCVSEIYYSDIEFPEGMIDWRQIYKISSNPTTIKGLYSALSSKAGGEGGRQENLNQVLYDLYNCNLYKEGQIPSIIEKPRENNIGNVYKNIMDNYFSERYTYGLGKTTYCTLDAEDKESNCIYMDNISYTGGAELEGTSDRQSEMTIKRVGGLKIDDLQLEVKSISEQKVSDVQYCKGINCYKYDKNKDLESYDYPTGTSRTESLSFRGRSVSVPSNSYALFVVTTTVGFYNDSTFQTVPSSGYIVDAKSQEAKNAYIPLPKYTYPVSKDAYLLCEADSAEIRRNAINIVDTNSRSCKISYKFGRIETYFRKNASDKFSQKVHGDYMNPNCYYDVKTTPPKTPPSSCKSKNACIPGDTVEYKNVNKESIFPTSVAGTNWDNDWAEEVRTYVEQTGTPEQKLAEENLEYRIILTPEQIDKIRKYNRANANYQNAPVDLDSCDKDDTGEIIKFYNCKSVFMDEMRASDEYGSLDINHNGSEYKVNSYEKTTPLRENP